MRNVNWQPWMAGGFCTPECYEWMGKRKQALDILIDGLQTGKLDFVMNMEGGEIVSVNIIPRENQ